MNLSYITIHYPCLVDFNPFVGGICYSCQAEIMRTLLTQKLMSAVGVGQTTAAEEGARNMSERCEPQGAALGTLCQLMRIHETCWHVLSMTVSTV
jgi:hypothetical protein